MTYSTVLRPRTLLAAGLALLLAACSGAPPRSGERSTPPAPSGIPDLPRTGGKYYQDDGPGDNVPDDLHTLTDAVPRDEPVHRATSRPYTVFGKRYVPETEREPFRERGRASWYGRKFHGKRTANGETYDMYAMTGAHKTLPLPSYVRVTNLANGRSAVVRVNDRGPFHSGRIIDLSYAAAYKLDYLRQGSAEVEIEALVFDDDAPLIAAVPPAAPRVPDSPAVIRAEAVPPALDPEAILNGVELPPVTEAAAAETVADAVGTPSGVYLQLGAFRTRDNAEGFRGYVASELDWLRDQLAVLLDAGRYRLHAGPYASVDAARQAAARIARALDVQPFLITR
ncbi:MAG: septal ring lytic transglycosylase RlpA family protein [Rhodocyclaceae bacterium]|nr:septal ring lytic transglycosylase RlpA family protein [Rhodocyclaceae bacterium]